MSAADDDPPLSLPGGEALTVERAGRLPADTATRVMVDAPAIAPVDVGDVVEVVRGRAPRAGDLVVCADAGGRCRLARLLGAAGPRVRVEVGPDGERVTLAPNVILGVATLLEQGDIVLDLTRGRWRVAGRLAAALPAGLGRGLLALAWLERLRRPLFPPLSLGDDEQILAQLAAAYDAEAEVIDRETELLREEELLIERYLAPGRRLLDVGCGTGREAIAFARLGVSVVGIDVAPAMIARARARARAAGLAIELAIGEPLTWPATGAPFDVIYFSPGVYSHIPGRARRVRTLARLRGLLAPGGLVALGPLLAPPLPWLARARLVDALRRLGRRAGLPALAEPGDHLHRGHAIEPPARAHRYVHRFGDAAEAEAELAQAGLVVTDRLDASWWIARPRP